MEEEPEKPERTCKHVDSEAPSPVPVHTLIPRLYNVEVLETPAT